MPPPTVPVRTLLVDDEPLAREHLRSLLSARDDITIIGECGDGSSAIERIRAERPELVLLDVQMPERGGFDVVRDIGPERMPAVIFVTAYDEHALAAFDVHATDYLLKPVNRQRFARAIDRVVRLLRAEPELRDTTKLARTLESVDTARPGADRLTVRVGERMLFLRVQDIDWIEASDDLAKLHVGKLVYDHRITLAQLEQRLPPRSFVRVHRSAIVNVDWIKEIQPWYAGALIVILQGGERLTVSRSSRARILALDRPPD